MENTKILAPSSPEAKREHRRKLGKKIASRALLYIVLILCALVMVLPFAVVTYYVIVARTFFSNSLPDDLWEAAQIDGCGNLRFFFQIVLPLSKAVIAVIALWTAVGQWNGYFNALIYLRTPELQPLQIVLRNILIGNQTIAAMSTGSAAVEAAQLADLIKYAIIVISSAPIMCMYPFVQKYFNQGVMIGALKG